MQEPPVTGFNPPGFKTGLALPSGANKSGLHRIDHGAVSMRSHHDIAHFGALRT
jgi:hypothetical protein